MILQQYRMVYQKYTSIVDKQDEINSEIETNKTQLKSLYQQSKIDFFETERLENKIMILEKSRETFSPELKQQLAQNYQRYLDWKNQESVININIIIQNGKFGNNIGELILKIISINTRRPFKLFIYN